MNKSAEQGCKSSTAQSRQDTASKQAWQSSYAFSGDAKKYDILEEQLQQHESNMQKKTTAKPEPEAFNAREAFRAAFQL